MAVRETLTVSLTPELRAFLRQKVNSGQYNSASEVVRAALRLLKEHEADLRIRNTASALHTHAE